MKTRRSPTLKQWLAVREVAGNGWGDGDYSRAYGANTKKKAELLRAMTAFEDWLESRYHFEFKVRLF